MPPNRPTLTEVHQLDLRVERLEETVDEVKTYMAESNQTLKYIGLQVAEARDDIKESSKEAQTEMNHVEGRLTEQLKEVKSSLGTLEEQVNDHEKALDLIADRENRASRRRQILMGLLGTAFGYAMKYLYTFLSANL